MTQPDTAICANCGKPIRHPESGSYPPEVEWVHVRNRMGSGNRYCGIDGFVAKPALRGSGDD
jgi:hypothetical protein